MKPETNNEQLILQAAEEEFLEKGYDGAKTMEIAKKAGVTHAMLHYYFRTKENLFQKVFQSKVQMIADSFTMIFDSKGSFETVIKDFIGRHFDFVARNPKLIHFVFHELSSNEKNRGVMLEIFLPKLKNILHHMENLIGREVAKGKIKMIKPVDLLMNIVSMNVISFMLHPIMKDVISGEDAEYPGKLLKERKESNIRFILNALKV